MRVGIHRDASVKDLGFRWPGSTRYPLEGGAAIYVHAAAGKLAALKVEYEATNNAQIGFSSDSALNLMKGKAVSKQNSALLDYICPHTGLTPLMAAVINGHYAVAHQLLEYGAKVDAPGYKSKTALQCLLTHGDLLDAKMLDLLLDAGASPFVSNESGMTALEYALRRHRHRFTRFPGDFEQMLQRVLNYSICAGPAEVKVSRAFGFSRPWVKRYCALVPYHTADKQHIDLVLLLLNERSLTVVERLTVRECKKSHYTASAQPDIHLTVQQPNRKHHGCMPSRDTEEHIVQLRAVTAMAELQKPSADSQLSAESEQHVVINQLVELAEMHPESVQFWLQGRAFTQTFRPTSALSPTLSLSPIKANRSGRTPLHRTDTCRLGSFRQRNCPLRRSGSLGIVDNSSRDVLVSQPLPVGRSLNPHGVLDSADSLFDNLTFHFQGV